MQKKPLKGIRYQIKNNPTIPQDLKDKKLSLSHLESYLLDLFKKKAEEQKAKGFQPDGVIHDEWIEDGQRCSMWTFTINGMTFSTGDGGKKLIYEQIKKLCK